MLFSRPKIYNIYIKKDADNALEDIIMVKEGFSIFAFIFSVFWAAYHRAWGLFLYYSLPLL